MKNLLVAQVSVNAPPPPQVFAIGYDTILIGGFTMALGCAIALGRWLIGREVKRFEEQIKDLSSAVQVIHKDVAELKTNLGIYYVSRDEHVRNATVTDAKLDALHRRSDEIMALLARGAK